MNQSTSINEESSTELEEPTRELEEPTRGMATNARFFLFQSGPIAIGITTLLVWPFLGNILNKDLFGQLSLQLAISSVLAPGLCLGASLYLANRLSTDPDANHSAEKKTAVCLSAVLFTLAILVSCVALAWGPANILLPLSLSSVNAAYLITSGVMRGLDRPAEFAAHTFLVQIAGLLTLGTVAKLTNSLQTAVLAYSIVISVPVISQYFMLRKVSKKTKLKATIPVMRKSLGLVPHLVLAVALLMMMRIIVSFLLGNVAVANYTFAALIIGGTLTIAASLDAHWSVRAQSSSSIDTLVIQLRNNQTKIHSILLVICTLVVVFLFFGLDLWLPPAYENAPVVWAVILALPAAPMQAIADGRAAILLYLDRSRAVSAATALGAAVTFICAIVVLPFFGWPAAGVCITAGMLARMLATIFLASRFTQGQSIGRAARIMLGIQLSSTCALLIIIFRIGS